MNAATHLRALAALLVLLLALPASAQEEDAQRKKEAQELAGAAKRAFDSGRFDEAAQRYLDAYQTFPAPRLLFNIAQAHRMNEKIPEALRFYVQYLQEEPDTPLRKEVEQWIASLTALLLDASDASWEITLEEKSPFFVEALKLSPRELERLKEAKISELERREANRKPLVRRWWFWVGSAALFAAGTSAGANAILQRTPDIKISFPAP